jgi:hypothetical protein
VTDKVPVATVEARLSAFVVEAIPNRVPAGPVDIVAVNMGFEQHEVVVLRYDGDPAALPVRDDGTLDEARLPEGALVGEIEAFAGQTESPETVNSHDLLLLNGPTACPAPFDLAAGEYLLLCNVIAKHFDGEVRAHFERGMFTRLTVTSGP